MKRILGWIVVAAALSCCAGPAAAWVNHTLGAWPALAAMPEINAAPAIRVETLDAFLAAEARGLEQLLQREEAWARANVPLYPPRPDALAFAPGGTPAELRQRFVAALRINPGMKLNLFVQARPGDSVSALAMRGGFDPARIYFHGNAKSVSELREALDAGVGHIVLDSLHEFDRLERIVAEHGRRQNVLLRVTPDVAGDTHRAISTGQADSKFGFSVSEARQAIDRLAGVPHLDLVGLHFHIGSQLFELEPFRAAVRTVAALGDFPVYNIGGGLGVAYTADQDPPAISDYVEAVVGTVHDELGRDKRLLLEPGRALVANSTVTLYTVETVKRNVSTWVAVDGGMSDNLRPMLYGSRYEALIADRPLAAPTERCNIAGKHCESGDVIVRDAPLPDPVPGDVLVTPVTGAYGYSMANNYNGVPRPPVIFCRDGNARVVVRRETYADLSRRDVDDLVAGAR